MRPARGAMIVPVNGDVINLLDRPTYGLAQIVDVEPEPLELCDHSGAR